MTLELTENVGIEINHWYPGNDENSVTINCYTADNHSALLFQWRPKWNYWCSYPPYPTHADPIDVPAKTVQEKLEEFAREHGAEIPSDLVEQAEVRAVGLYQGYLEPEDNETSDWYRKEKLKEKLHREP